MRELPRTAWCSSLVMQLTAFYPLHYYRHTCRNQQKLIRDFAAEHGEQLSKPMLLLGHYAYMTVPFFTVDLIVEALICGGEYSLFSFGGPEECKGKYNAERCMTDKTIEDTMSCRGMSEVVLRSLCRCSHWPGGSLCSHMPAYTLFASKVWFSKMWLSRVLSGTRL